MSGLITARAWCRVDFAGGTLDIWPLGLLHERARTVNLAIDVEVEVRLRPDRCYRVIQGEESFDSDSVTGLLGRPETALVGAVAEALELEPIEVRISSGSPRGGGLGASSALTIALIAAAEALRDLPPSLPRDRARLARDLEVKVMRLPTGTQDHYPALLGGALEIRYEPGSERVRQLDVKLDELGRHLLLIYTGTSHFSAATNWQIIRRRLEGEAEAAELLEGIAGVAAEIAPALEAGNWSDVGRLMSEEWGYRSRLAAGVSTPEIESLLDLAAGLGAWGGKACGAGGGGCLALMVPEDQRAAIAEALERQGGRVLKAQPAEGGLEVEAAV